MKQPLNQRQSRDFLVVQWLILCTPKAGNVGLIPDWGAKIPHAMQLGD